MRVMKSDVTRLALLLIVLVLVTGCALTKCPDPKPLPPRPVLESMTENDLGGICLDRQDLTDLLKYIDTLERR